jgi:HD-GYP domain-containing protein (c-di-GMP phosphodiesterase class II)
VPSFFRDNLLGILLLGKKEDNSRFKKDELGFFSALASDVAMAIRNAQLFKELQEELDKRRSLFMHTTIALAAAVDAKDHYTHGHISRVTSYSQVIAKKLKERENLDEKFMENLEIASLLHDIGKIGTPERVLNKTDILTVGERNIVQKHPVDGVTILQAITELEEALPGVKHHHERYDGSGYPDGLKGKEIPLIAAIIAVADTYDAMTTDRPYRKALSREAANSELLRCSGTQLDPEVVKAAVEVL